MLTGRCLALCQATINNMAASHELAWEWGVPSGGSVLTAVFKETVFFCLFSFFLSALSMSFANEVMLRTGVVFVLGVWGWCCCLLKQMVLSCNQVFSLWGNATQWNALSGTSIAFKFSLLNCTVEDKERFFCSHLTGVTWDKVLPVILLLDILLFSFILFNWR